MNHDESECVKHGKTLVIIAAAMIAVFLLLSSGYDPRLGLLTSLYYTMTIYDGKWFCHEISRGEFIFGTDTICQSVALHTKYLVTLCVIVITYAVLMIKNLASDPIQYVKEKLREINRRKGTDAPSKSDRSGE